MPTRGDVEAAAIRLRGLISDTPLVRSTWLSDATGADVWLKLELRQPTGSFKVRGAANALATLLESYVASGLSRTHVVTASAGNHGLALAWAARRLGMQVRVHLPASAPAVKRLALAELGAELIEAPSYQDAERQAHADAKANDIPYISPYGDSQVIAGAGTCALEMLADRPDLEALIVPLGGGGLLAGTAIVAKSHRAGAGLPAPLAIGAEAEASPVFSSSLAAGRVVRVDVKPTLADGLAGNMDPQSPTFGLVRDLADRVMLVSETSIRRAMRELLAHEHLIVEGSGAAGVAAMLQEGSGVLNLRGRRVGVILTGRNVDLDLVQTLL